MLPVKLLVQLQLILTDLGHQSAHSLYFRVKENDQERPVSAEIADFCQVLGYDICTYE